MICAARGGHTEVVRLLLEQEGIDVNIKNILKAKIFHKIHFIVFNDITNILFVWNFDLKLFTKQPLTVQEEKNVQIFSQKDQSKPAKKRKRNLKQKVPEIKENLNH